MATEKSGDARFTIWLGDGWPGPYVVTVTSAHAARPHTIVVMGATDVSDAVKRAEAALPAAFKDVDSMSVTNGHMVEADGTISTPHPQDGLDDGDNKTSAVEPHGNKE